MDYSIGSDLLNSELPPELIGILPGKYSYKLSKWAVCEENPSHFEAVILTNVHTEEEAQQWWNQFNIQSNTTMRIKATCPKTGKFNVFKIYLRCTHQGRTDIPGTEENEEETNSRLMMTKNTNCPSQMVIAIRRHIKYKKSTLRDPVDPVHPCEIKLTFNHNHPTYVGGSGSKSVSKEVEEKLLNLYQMGHSPSTALEVLKIDLQIQYMSRYEEILKDPNYAPSKGFCYRLYYKHLGKDYSHAKRMDLNDALDAKVLHYNNSLGEKCLATRAVQGLNPGFVIAVCTPLMKRAHSLPQCCDVVFTESYEYIKEQSQHYVILLVALTAAGGLPLGAVLTTNNNTKFWTVGFQLLQELLPTYAFSCKGTAGPSAFLIKNSEIQRAALLDVWPTSRVLTCIFRILQYLWRWLWDERHAVLKEHRLYLLFLAKTFLFASNDLEMNQKYIKLRATRIAIRYPKYLEVIVSLWEKRQTWKVSAYEELQQTLPGASNYYEAAGRALKDKFLQQAKTFNILQMLNYLVTRLDSYYEIKVLDIINCKSLHVFRTYFPTSIPTHVDNEMYQVSGNYFLVPNQQEDGNKSTVDPELNVCSCPNGINGALCLHQYWVFLKKPAEMFKVKLCDPELRQKLSVVVTGKDDALMVAAHEIESLPLPISNSSKFPDTEVITDPFLGLSDNSTEKGVSLPQATSDQVVCLTCGQEGKSVPISVDSCNLDASASLENGLLKPIESENSSTIADTDIEENVNEVNDVINYSVKDHVQVETNNADNEQSNATDSSEDIDVDFENTIEERTVEVLEKFDSFCDRVRKGLQEKPNDFLPALEIMMKNLERKRNTDDVLVSGLSFFGVISAPSSVKRGRKPHIYRRIFEKKECSTLPRICDDELVPKVYGRPMMTYSKRARHKEGDVNGLNYDKLCK